MPFLSAIMISLCKLKPIKPSLYGGLLTLICTALFFTSVQNYNGSILLFTVFSFVYLILLFSGIKKNTTYGYMFFAIVMWLGFWLKTVIHLILNYPFVEPIGLFIGSPREWDQTLFVATVGAIGIIAGRVFYGLMFNNPIETKLIDTTYSAPDWYMPKKHLLWAILIICIISFATLNIIFSFQQIGLVPKTKIWPLNAIFSWLLSTGFAMATVTLLWWEILISPKSKNALYLVLFEAAVSSVSLLSRGLYIFHSVPLLTFAFVNRKRINNFNLKWMLFLIFSFTAILLVSYILVNAIRDYYYSAAPFSDLTALHLNSFELVKRLSIKLAAFSVDRWIGIEGLMATVAHPEKSISLLISAITEKGEIGKISLFQNISLSHYRYSDLTKFIFASLPGPMSFFYFSGLSIFVFAGMTFVSLIVLVSERLVYKFLHNPLLTAFWGGFVASNFSQMGVDIPRFFFNFLLCILGIIFLYFIQNHLTAIANFLKNR